MRFLNWCVEERRISSNPCPGRAVPRLNEELDRRRQRRPFTEEELDRLFGHLGEEPRAICYRLALLTGLRRSELGALRWGDIDLGGREPCIRLRAEGTKAKRAEELPLHRDAVEILQRLRDGSRDRTGRVLSAIPPIRRLYLDLASAGIQAIDGWKPIPDPSGRVLDFHSFRATLATILANRGVAPLHLKRIMRHRSIETTDRHYTGLRLLDLGRELDRLGPVGKVPTLVPTPNARNGAFGCSSVREDGSRGSVRGTPATPESCGNSRSDAARCGKAGDGIRTRDILLGRQGERPEFLGNLAIPSASANPSANPPRAEGDLGTLVGLLGELPGESISILLALALKLRERAAATG